MSAAMTRIAKRQGRLPALVASLGVAAWLFFVTLVGVVLQVIALGADGLETITLWPYLFSNFLTHTLPFALGLFISLWAIAPISHELTLPFVLTRGALATAAGAVVAFVVAIFVSLFGSFVPGAALFGNSFPFSSFDGGYFASQIGADFQSLVLTFLNLLPLVLLATVLLWLWLKAHPREYAVAGLIDDV